MIGSIGFHGRHRPALQGIDSKGCDLVARTKKLGLETNDSPAVAESETSTAGESFAADAPDAMIVEEADQAGVPEVEASDAEAVQTPPIETSRPETADIEKISPPREPARQSSGAGFWTMLFGGAIAAAAGFGTSQYLDNDAWPFSGTSSETEQLLQAQSQKIEGLSSDIADLQTQVQTEPNNDAPIQDLQSGQETLRTDVSTLTVQLETFNQRLSDLENRPIPEGGATADAVAAYQEQLAGMRAMFEQELTRIEAAQSKAVAQEQTAADRAEQALVQAAFVRLQAAIESGVPFSETLQDLAASGVEVPGMLNERAGEGVPTLAALQQSYPAAARAALQASVRAQADSGETDRFTAFLRSQLGTRSLEPKAGDDPDAVLSRAEAALRDGDLGRALTELQALPEAGSASMANWVSQAEIRLQAVSAIADLSNSLNN